MLESRVNAIKDKNYDEANNIKVNYIYIYIYI